MLLQYVYIGLSWRHVHFMYVYRNPSWRDVHRIRISLVIPCSSLPSLSFWLFFVEEKKRIDIYSTYRIHLSSRIFTHLFVCTFWMKCLHFLNESLNFLILPFYANLTLSFYTGLVHIKAIVKFITSNYNHNLSYF